MKLKSTDSLEVLLAGAVATNQCPLTAGYTDVATDASTCAPSSSDGQTNGTTAVTWVAAPAAGLVREISTLSFRNEDTASVTATVRLNNGTTTRNRRKFVLAAGEGFAYESGSGFTVFAADGNAKGAGSSVTSVNGATGAVVLGGESIAEPVNALATSGTIAIDCALGDYFTLAAAGNMTSFTFSNLPASGKAQTIMVRITQDATGSRVATWPSSFKWAGGTAGVLSTAANSVDVLAITTFNQGTTWNATLAKAFA